MMLWIVQLLIDVVIVGLAVSWVLQRRRLLALEGELEGALRALREGPGHVAETPRIETPLGAPTSTLTEKSIGAQTAAAVLFGKAPSEAYRQALDLLEQSAPTAEIVRRTGLSASEIQLLSKFNGSLKNNEAH